MDLLDKADLPAPEFMSEAGHFTVTFRIPVDKRLTMQVTPQVAQLLEICTIPLSRQEMQDKLRLRNRDHFRKNYLNPARNAGLIERTQSQSPKNKLQKYRLTRAGSIYLMGLQKVYPVTRFI